MRWPFARELSEVLGSHTAKASSSPSTRFAFKLFRELAAEGGSNLFFSPSSVMLCLALVHELASGETREDMASALEIADLDPVNLQLTITGIKAAFYERPDVTVTAANSLWYSDRAQLDPKFAAQLRDLYDAELVALDFGSADAVPRINAWVNDKTKGRIGRILNALSPLAVLIAVNAVYFKGRWSKPFVRAVTRDGPFTIAPGRTKQLPMMRQSGKYKYYEGSGLQAVALPYAGSIAMHVVLPSERTDSQKFQRGLTSGLWESWLAELRPTPGSIQLPRFKLDYEGLLEPALKALGMERPFDRNRAEFDGIRAGQLPVWIDQVSHRAIAEVNEEGTEAAAVTGTLMLAAAMRPTLPPREFQMIVDRPFFVVIRDEATATILFMGWVSDPQ
jgi:serine protease inhibitor